MLFSYFNHILGTSRLVFKGQSPRPAGDFISDATSTLKEQGANLTKISDAKKAESEKKKHTKKTIQESAEKKINKSDTKEKLNKARKEAPGKLFENKDEKEKILKEVAEVQSKDLAAYYTSHMPDTYTQKAWKQWNLDFASQVMNIENPDQPTAKKYAWAFQNWLNAYNPGYPDRKIGKKTMTALGRYLDKNDIFDIKNISQQAPVSDKQDDTKETPVMAIHESSQEDKTDKQQTLEDIENAEYKYKPNVIGIDAMKKNIDISYARTYGWNLDNLKNSPDHDPEDGAIMTNYLEEGDSENIKKAYREYMDTYRAFKEQRKETDTNTTRASSSASEKEAAKLALTNAEKEKDKALKEIGTAINNEINTKKRALDQWLETHDLPEKFYVAFVHNEQIIYRKKKVPMGVESILGALKNSERAKIFKDFHKLVKNCDIEKLRGLEDSLPNSQKTPEAILELFNDAIFAKNIEEYKKFMKKLYS